jgi:hypothetical protein
MLNSPQQRPLNPGLVQLEPTFYYDVLTLLLLSDNQTDLVSCRPSKKMMNIAELDSESIALSLYGTRIVSVVGLGTLPRSATGFMLAAGWLVCMLMQLRPLLFEKLDRPTGRTNHLISMVGAVIVSSLLREKAREAQNIVVHHHSACSFINRSRPLQIGAASSMVDGLCFLLMGAIL